MAGVDNSKVRVLAVAHILRNSKDGATVRQILETLALRFDIVATNKVIYRDMIAIDRLYPVEYTGQAGGHKWRFINER